MSDVVVVGPSSWNHLVVLDKLPEPVPHMQFAERDFWTVGGTSAGKALHLTALGRSVLLATPVGADAEGERVAEALARAGVAVLLERTDGPTERHLNLMDTSGGRVSLYLSMPAAQSAAERNRVRATFAGARALVLDLSPRAAGLLDDARATGVPVWTDLHDYDGVAEFHRPFLEAASAVFCNADALGDPVPFLRSVVASGAEIAVCTLGAEGAVAVDAAGEVHRVPAVSVAKIVDTNGAGDAFFAGFLNAHLDGADTAAALRAAAAQAPSALGSTHLSPLLDPAHSSRP